MLKLCALTSLLAVSLAAQPQRILRTRNSPAPFTVNTGSQIVYHGGPLLLGTVNVYLIWYGPWDASISTVQPLVEAWADGIGNSAYFDINQLYGTTQGDVSGAVALKGEIFDAGSRGTALTDVDIQAIPNAAITSGKLPLDPNGVYYVLLAAGISDTAFGVTFGQQFCGYHSPTVVNGTTVEYVMAGDTKQFNGGAGACQVQITGPNGGSTADGMVNVMTHELEESVTDPQLNGYYFPSGAENADECAWQFGNLYTAANGTEANMNFGGHDWLIQMNWVPAKGGYCSQLNDSATKPTVSILSPVQGQTLACNSTGNVQVPISATAVDYLGNAISGNSIYLQSEGAYWCAPDMSCGESGPTSSGAGNTATFSLPCTVAPPQATYPGTIWSGSVYALATDAFGHQSAVVGVGFYVTAYSPPPPPPPPTLTISPANPSPVHAGGTLQFTANEAVTWSLAGPGSINASGLYQAPAKINGKGQGNKTVTVTATAGTQHASVTVTLQP